MTLRELLESELYKAFGSEEGEDQDVLEQAASTIARRLREEGYVK